MGAARPWLALALLGGGCAGAGRATPEVTVGDAQVLMTRAELDGLGLRWFPDGLLGLRWDPELELLHLRAANSGQTAHLVGTPRLPALVEAQPALPLREPRADYDYAAGGPLWTGEQGTLMMLHLERHPNGPEPFVSSLGVAWSEDDGASFVDRGEVLLPSVSRAEAVAAERALEVGGGALVAREGHLYAYYTDYAAGGAESGLAVARADAAQVLSAAVAGEAAPWTKWGPGGWEVPGDLDGDRGGEPELLVHGARWPSATDNLATGQVLVVYTTGDALWLAASADGVRFGEPALLVDGGGDELFYPTIVPAHDALVPHGPSVSTERFWVYATRSATGGFGRWQDADWVRYEVWL